NPGLGRAATDVSELIRLVCTATGPRVATSVRGNGAAALQAMVERPINAGVFCNGGTQPKSAMVRTPGRVSNDPAALEEAWVRIPKPPPMVVWNGTTTL